MADPFQVVVLPAARKALAKIHPVARHKLLLAAQALSHNPFPPISKRLVTPREIYRIRVDRYRLVYTVREEQLVVLVVAAGHRKDVYRSLKN